MDQNETEQIQRAKRARDEYCAMLRYAEHPPVEKFKDAHMAEAYYRQLKIRLESDWSDVGLGSRHSNRLTLRGGRWKTAFGHIRNKIGTGLIQLLTGPRGTGKTQMGAELCRVSVEAGRQACYNTLAGICREIRATYVEDASRNEELVIASYTSTPGLLVIDEIHESADTDFEQRILTEIVDKRYAEERDTLLIGNVMLQDVSRLIGSSVASRMAECGGIVKAEWESFR